ncbi:MAG: ester cyclase [Pelagibaca sp.]
MPGFEDRWSDVPDFILGITRDIWEDRGIHTLHEYYGPELVVRSPASVITGNTGIIAATQATLAEFPDRALLGEDVIWCPTGQDSFLSSHRLYCTATHEGAGVYGAPTGRRLAYRILADCWCRDNGVHDEWLVRDQGAIVRQMGMDVVDWTRDLIAREGGPEACVKPMTPASDLPGSYTGTGNENAWGQELADILTRIATAEFSVIPQAYHRAAELAYPGHITGAGHRDADRFWMQLHAAIPNARFSVDHQIGMEEPLSPARAAVRWSLQGTHSGWGMFGTPTGADIYIMGITQAEFGRNGLRREWTLIDETAIWKQILLASGNL